jgi:4-hydroxyphenylpyruvate dioxygenase
MNFSLWPACVKTHSFAGQLAAAAAGGFTHLPIGLVTYRALRAAGLRDADIVSLAAEHQIQLGHFDGFSAWAPVPFNDDLPAAAKAVFDSSAQSCLEICAGLGLTTICATGTFNPGQFATAQLADGFARFCEQAQPLGIRVDLEFLPMWGIPTLDVAWDILSGSGASNAGILLDTWHFYHGRADFALLEALPAGAITTVQLADALQQWQGASLFEECLRFRRLPGTGELDLQRVLTILQAKGGVVDIGPEIFSDALDLLPAVTAAQQASAACRQVMQQAGWN